MFIQVSLGVSHGHPSPQDVPIAGLWAVTAQTSHTVDYDAQGTALAWSCGAQGDFSKEQLKK